MELSNVDKSLYVFSPISVLLYIVSSKKYNIIKLFKCKSPPVMVHQISGIKHDIQVILLDAF